MVGLTAHRVATRHEDGTTTIVLDRAERANALDAATVDAVIAGIDEAERLGSTVVVLRSAARQFCAGFDLDGVGDASSADLVQRFLRIGHLLERLQTTPALTVAVLEGPAIGAGADLAAACDVRLATPSANLRFPGSAFGIVLGTRRLAALVGSARAVRLASTGQKVGADEALGLGLVDLVADAAVLDQELSGLVADAARRSPRTLAALKSSATGPDPAGLADLARSLVDRTDLAACVARFARTARPSAASSDQSAPPHPTREESP